VRAATSAAPLDANKRKKLKVIGYTIPPTCGTCTSGVFPQNEWGTCATYQYDHQKHTGDARQLSIHKTGSCSSYNPDSVQLVKLGTFNEFFHHPDPNEGKG
jgi:hypothetical protein